MSDKDTKELFDEYFLTRPETTTAKIRKIVDREELYAFEREIGKQLVEMDTMEIIKMLSTFSRKTKSGEFVPLSYRTMDAAMSILRSFFNWYIDEYEIIKNPCNDKRTKGRAAESFFVERIQEKVSKEKIEEAINSIRKSEIDERADYCEAVIRLLYDGFSTTLEIVNLKEEDIDHNRQTVKIDGIEHQLSSRTYYLLKKVHNIEFIPAYRGEYKMIPFDDSYFTFPSRTIVKGEKDAQYYGMYLSRLFCNRIRPYFNFNITTKAVYLCGLYDMLCRKYGKENVDAMLAYEGEGEHNAVLEKEFREYGAKGNTSYIKKDIRINVLE